MASGTINFTQSASSGSYIDGKIEWSTIRDDDANRTIVKAKLYVKKGNTDMTLTIPTDGTWSCNITIHGATSTLNVSKAVLEDWVLLRTYTVGIPYENTQISVAISGSITAPTETSLEGHTTKGSATIKIDPIPQAATIESLKCSTSYLDGTITALYTPKSAACYNRRIVYVNIDGALTAIRTTDLGSKAAVQQPSTINLTDAELSKVYAKVTTAGKTKIRVTFRTYSDSDYTVKVGDDQYLEITLSLPTSVAPSAELKITPVNPNTWLAGKNIFAYGLSGATVELSATPGEGAKLTETSIVYNGATYDAIKLNITPLKNTGDIDFVAKATDSRGRTATATETITVLPYAIPSVTSMQAERGTYDSDWTANDSGPDVRIAFEATLKLTDEGNKYNAAFKLDGATITPDHGTVSKLDSSTSYEVYFCGLDGEASHALMLSVTDSVGQTGTAVISTPTTHVTVEYRANGKGIAFGKTSEKDAFECAWPAYFNDAVYITDKITCPNAFALRDFNINCNWADGAGHDLLVRRDDGLTTGLGWSGSGDDDKSYETVLDVRPKKANFRGVITAPRGRFTATNDLSGTERKDVALRIGDEDGQHIDMDTNEIQAKTDPTTPGPLYLNLNGGDVYANDFRIPEIQRGSAKVTPSAANTPTSLDVAFEKEFSGTPTVIVTPYTSVPGTTVLGVGVNGASKTGFTLWVTRSNTTETSVHWIAIY